MKNNISMLKSMIVDQSFPNMPSGKMLDLEIHEIIAG